MGLGGWGGVIWTYLQKQLGGGSHGGRGLGGPFMLPTPQ